MLLCAIIGKIQPIICAINRAVSATAKADIYKAAINKEVNAVRCAHAPGRQLEVLSCSFSQLKANSFLEVGFIIAPPSMAYMEYSTKIYQVYLKYVAPEDIEVNSIDEVFMDVTGYLPTYKLSPRDLAMKIILDVIETTGITATAGK